MAVVVNTPVDSTTYSAPAFAHGIAFGSFSENTWIARPFTDNFPQDVFVISTSPLTEEACKDYARVGSIYLL